MAFSRFTQFFKFRSNTSTKDMKILFRNQFFVYFWSQRIRKSFRIYNFYIKRFQEQRLIGLFKNIRINPVSCLQNVHRNFMQLFDYIFDYLILASS